MKTPQEKYMNDPEYHTLVNNLEVFIERAHFTPSELREAVVFACIRHEMRTYRPIVIDKKVAEALGFLETFAQSQEIKPRA